MAAAAGWRAGGGAAADGFVVAALARLSGFPAMGFCRRFSCPGCALPSGMIVQMAKAATFDSG